MVNKYAKENAKKENKCEEINMQCKIPLQGPPLS
jgi:hypothetical protein